MINKKKVMVTIISVICLVVAGKFIYNEFILTQNIFDQIFYTRIRTSYSWWGIGNKADSFSKMPQIESVSRDDELYFTMEGIFVNNYKSEHLREGEKLRINCSPNTNTIHIVAQKRTNEFLIIYRYDYDINTKILQIEIGFEYGEPYINEFNIEVFKEYTKDIQEIILAAEGYGLTEEDFQEYKNYFLYDKLLTDWLSANKSRFSINDLGNVEFVEALPLADSE